MRNAPLLVHARYQPGAELGRGGQGVVLRVTDREAPQRALVAKIWHEGRFAEAALAGEFALLRRLDIPGLVRAHDLARDESSGAPFLVEDFVDGASASDVVLGAGAERAEYLVRILAEVTTTLAAMHEASFVHGDLKPEHVRESRDGRVFLLDLGAAVRSSHARVEAAALTPAYAAPELLAGERPSARSDLYALGALGWALARGEPPARVGRRSKLRAACTWLPPSVAELIEHLLQPHPRDRPESAEAVLAALGSAGVPSSRRLVPAPVGRERELAQLSTPAAGVRYVVGPSGVGKSHLLRELQTRALLGGRAVRRLVFPHPDSLLVSELITFLRGEGAAWPFTVPRRPGTPLLLALDDLHAAPLELVSALDAYRCRAWTDGPLDIVATLREAPDGAHRFQLGPLPEAAFDELCERLAVVTLTEKRELARASGKNPGWLVAARGRVPLTRDMVLERTRTSSRSALELLAGVAACGGAVPPALLLGMGAESEVAELLAAGLLTRRAGSYALEVPELAPDIAASLGSFEVAERTAALLLAGDSAPRHLLALAGSAFPPSSRELLLKRAAELAERAGLASEQTDALLALAANPAQREPELLTRLERLTRSAGSNHPQVLSWLHEAAQRHPELAPLSLRRQAEQAARAGDFERAEALAHEACRCSAARADRLAEALALGTRGAVALFRADVAAAEAALVDARARLSTLVVSDLEELARVDHNLGVVALYRDRLEDAVAAFERALSIKRRLGDRAGVRSCLLNLGLSLSRLGRYERAAQTLTEAHSLAQALQQHAGRAWCLAAHADLELRRKDALRAERFLAEAESIAQAPPSVRADLCILRAQLALLSGDAQLARAALSALPPELRAQDAMIDARARVVEASALLASLPAEPIAAARLAIAAARAARAASLSEVEAQALAVLRQARRKSTPSHAGGYTRSMPEAELAVWHWLEGAASGKDAEASLLELLGALRATSGAERVLLAACRADGTAERAWGVDLESFALPSALERCDSEFLRAALEARGPLYQRDVKTLAGHGSRLAVPTPPTAPHAVLLLEQRFRPGSFDTLSSDTLQRFALLAALALRLQTSPAVVAQLAQPAQVTTDPGQSTALPVQDARRHFPHIIGESRALRAALSRLQSALGSDLPVLISGETGTGKELFARALHEQGPRRAAPFVAVNCAAIPEALFEAELFGHARGAFTGAERARGGLLARAEGGTLFLDEIGELPLARQATLLRVLESRRFRSVGSDDERSCDVRVVTATNRDLAAEVAAGNFRQDLLYRINVIELRVPALRERPEDIPILVAEFLARCGGRSAFSAEAMSALAGYEWPGNVRELEHQVQRLLTLGLARIELKHLPRTLRQGMVVSSREPAGGPAHSPLDARGEVEQALARCQGNITHAARALGLTRHGLKKRMLRLGVRAMVRGGDS